MPTEPARGKRLARQSPPAPPGRCTASNPWRQRIGRGGRVRGRPSRAARAARWAITRRRPRGCHGRRPRRTSGEHPRGRRGVVREVLQQRRVPRRRLASPASTSSTMARSSGPPVMICSCRVSTRDHRRQACARTALLLRRAARAPPAGLSRRLRVRGEPTDDGEQRDRTAARPAPRPRPPAPRRPSASTPSQPGADGGRHRPGARRPPPGVGRTGDVPDELVEARDVVRAACRAATGSGSTMRHSALARPAPGEQRTVETQPGVGDGRDRVAQPGAAPRPARAGGPMARPGSASTAAADCRRPRGSREPVRRSPRRRRPRPAACAASGTPRRRASRWTWRQCGRRKARSAGVVHRPARRAGRPPDRVSTVSTGAVHRRWTGRPLPTLPAVRTERDDAERGSTLPFVLVCWTVAALMAFGAIAASDAFLEQQEVQSVCDGAALAAANRADEAVVYTDGVDTELPLTRADRAGRGGRPARRRRHTAGRVVGRDRRRRGDGPLHALRGHRLRLALPRRRAARAHGDRQRPRADAPLTGRRPPTRRGRGPSYRGVAGEGFEPS